MFVIERSTQRKMTDVMTNNGRVIPVAYQLYVHMLIVGTDQELAKFCGKSPEFNGIKNLCSSESNAILCKYSYDKRMQTTSDGVTEIRMVGTPVDSGAADYMVKYFDKPIVRGKRNFSFFGIESQVKERWERVYKLQQRALALIADVQYQMKLKADPASVLQSVIKVLDKRL
jgi:hypothetical protein